MQLIDITGQRFGQLTVLGYLGAKKWECQCECGGAAVCLGSNLKRGNSTSCGCRLNGVLRKRNETHGLSRHPNYAIWCDMLGRCGNPNRKSFKNYGARGIEVCDRWRYGEGGMTGFECFLADVGSRPRGKSLDRVDNDRGYSPDNCRWASSAEQSRNRRNVRLSEDAAAAIRTAIAEGVSQADLAREYGVSKYLIHDIRRGKSWLPGAPSSA